MGLKKMILVVAMLAFAGIPVLGQEMVEDPDTARAKEVLRELEESGEFANEAEKFDAWIEALSDELGPEHPQVLKALSDAAWAFYDQVKYRESLRFFEREAELSTKVLGAEHPDTLTAVDNLAHLAQALGDLQRAQDLQEEVLAARSRIQGAEHPDTLTTKANLAVTLYALGDLSGARQHQEEVLTVRSRILGAEHPDTLTTKANLAVTLYALGDLSGARQREEEVLAVRSRILGAEHPDTLTAKANLASTLYALGDFSGARQREEEVLEVQSRILGAEHPNTLATKGNLAATLRALGELSGARQREEEVLKARSRVLGAEHPETLKTKSNLAHTLYALGDLSGARQRYEEVIEVFSRVLGAEHPDTLTAKSNLAGPLRALGDFSGARQREEEVLEARSRILGAEHPNTLKAKSNLASTLYALGDFSGARQRYEEVVEVLSRILGAEHPDTWSVMHNLASTLRNAGDLESARKLFEKLIELRSAAFGSEHRPSTEEEAKNFFGLGVTQRELGRFDEAYASLLAGLEALEAQILRADLAEDVKTRFKAEYGNAYRAAVAVSLDRQKPSDAFHLLERYRAQSLLALLRWSRPDSGRDIPEELREELGEIASRYDWITRQLHRESDQDLLAEQAQLRRRREVIQGRIIEIRRAEEDLPRPLQLEEVRRVLEPGTLLLAYSIGSEASHLFGLTREGPLEVHPLETEAPLLRLQVGRLRAIDLGAEEASPESRRNLSLWLYDKLLGPAAERIDRADRVLILADGPLHYLPFAALTRPVDEDPRGWQYLVEWKPIHTVQSATVYAELLARRPDPESDDTERAFQWVGFGDPVYPVKVEEIAKSEKPDDDRLPAQLRSTIERGIWDGLTELPYTDHEIRKIAAQFPEGRAEPLLDHEATEDRARQILGNTRIAHFATHGVADPEYPLDSFLALSLLEGEDDLEQNGLLQAWEIIDHLHLDADLVVLSACVTAFGPNRAGEGLLSLSRAFQIAGARTVMASLWAVNDASTSELMIRFYRHLLAGEPKDRALQLAQLELIRGPVVIENEEGEEVEHDFSAPYHWAAFQLIGDWQ